MMRLRTSSRVNPANLDGGLGLGGSGNGEIECFVVMVVVSSSGFQ